MRSRDQEECRRKNEENTLYNSVLTPTLPTYMVHRSTIDFVRAFDYGLMTEVVRSFKQL